MHDVPEPPSLDDIVVFPPFGTMPPQLARAWRLSCTGEVETALAEAQRVLDQAVAEGGDTFLRGMAANHMAWYCFMLAYYEEGILHVLSARDMFQARGDRARESWSRCVHAWLLIEIGAPNEALDEAMLALELAESCRQDLIIAFALNVVGVVFWMLRQLDRALEFSERAVALARHIGDGVELARWLINLAGIEAEFWHLGYDDKPDALRPEAVRQRMERAVLLAQEAQVLSNEATDTWAERIALCNLAEYELFLGRPEAAAAVLAKWNQLGGGGGTRSQIYYLFALGKLQLATGALEEAVETLRSCAEASEDAGDLEIGVPCCRYVAEAHGRLGHFEDALRWHREFHARHVRRSTDTSQIRSRVAAIHYETNQLRTRVDAERSRADGLEQMNLALAQEAKLLMHASMEDVLTGLPNRRRLERALLDVGSEAKLYAFAMMDIDKFKLVNDTFSHSVGDDVLRQVATLLRDTTRDTDLLFRYGGEEFVLLMGETSILAAAKICRRVQEVVRSWNWALIHPDLRVTLSIGVAESEEADSPAQVMSIADERLYEAKHTGRDRVVTQGRFAIQHAGLASPLLH
jgi:diguanylate cyclase (GGDEF)-like protein